MRPLSVITGILLGSSAAIAFGLLVVAFIYLLLGEDYPHLRTEFTPLLASVGIFTILTTICAFSFISLLRQKPSRWILQGLMWLGLALTGFYYWP
jgi:hypothetical protein